jgi:lipid A 3-O-deacylase
MNFLKFQRPTAIRRILRAIFAGCIFLASGSVVQAAEEDDPSFLTIGAGYFDILHDDDAAEFRLEYRDEHRFWIFKPFAGTTVTSHPSFYGYAGVLTDFYFGNRVVVSPSVAVGAYIEGSGKDLGHVFEIRSGLEVAYRFDDRSRLGVMFYHISNAGLGDDENPGAEVLSLSYSFPLKGF